VGKGLRGVELLGYVTLIGSVFGLGFYLRAWSPSEPFDQLSQRRLNLDGNRVVPRHLALKFPFR
jgi:hypothetical protein